MLDQRRASKLQIDIEDTENIPAVIDHPTTVSPDVDKAGTALLERNSTPTVLPVWSDEQGFDNPAFEESTVSDSMYSNTLLSLIDKKKHKIKKTLLYHCEAGN